MHRTLVATADGTKLPQALHAFGQADAEAQARAALIYGDARPVLESAAAAWLSTRLQPLSGEDEASRDAGLNTLIAELLRGIPGLPPLRPAPAQARIRSLLHRFLSDAGPPPADEDPASRWPTLELQRFALASAATLQPEWSPPSEAITAAETLLLAALGAEQGALATRLDAYAADGNDAGERTAYAFGVFDALESQCERLGLHLDLPAPSAVAAALQADETLVQLWFDGSGRGHALILRASGLAAQVLPEPLARPAWQPLLQTWAASRAGTGAAWDAAGYLRQTPAAPVMHTDPAMQVIAQAWAAFVAEESPASRLLRWLLADPAVTDGGRLILILPAELACLPWLARAVAGRRDEPDFAPGRLVLEASVSAWWLARRATPPDAGAHVAQAVYTPLPLAEQPFGELEARRVASLLGGRAVQAGGVIELLRALLSPGPAHLSVHGRFDTDDPLSSVLSLSGEEEEDALPLWLLHGCAVQGDVALSACEGMLVGPGARAESAWNGALGIGPLLRAQGARTVIGPLGKLDPVVSLIFYPLWYEARRELPATRALAQAQQRLRTMTMAEYRQRIAQTVTDPSQRAAIEQHVLSVLLPDGAEKPFSHPLAWVQFALLGDAPPLPLPQAPLGAREPLRGWWQELVQRFRRPSRRG
ncbi:MAG: CHAT domain-containing protein [Accumulibacter sp.]|uniref:CHAT domain-containing protein n=1 Tax=Accumulibacter sp. TaxID=2053492 RepID=UPI002FC3AD0B